MVVRKLPGPAVRVRKPRNEWIEIGTHADARRFPSKLQASLTSAV